MQQAHIKDLGLSEAEDAEEVLRRANERMRLAAEVADVGFWERDLRSNTVYLDEVMLRRIRKAWPAGRKLPEEPLLEIVHPDDRERLLQTILSGHGGARTFQIEYRIVMPDGSVGYLRSVGSVQRDARGRPIRIVGANFDMTAQRQAEEKLLQALAREKDLRREAEVLRRRAERADKAKSRFLANMSHEVRTPLSALVSLSQAMWTESGREKHSPRFTKALNSIRSGGKYLNIVLTNLLDVSAAERGRIPVSRETFYVGDWVADMRNILEPIAQAQGATIKWAMPSYRDAKLTTDRMRLSQVLLNLAHNAIKFGPEDKCVVRIALATNNGALRLMVEDNGPGIPPAKISRLFRAFAQNEVAKSSYDRGVGLGLAVVQINLRLLGGSIKARNRVGGGMQFTVEIPAMSTVRKPVRRKKRPLVGKSVAAGLRRIVRG